MSRPRTPHLEELRTHLLNGGKPKEFTKLSRSAISKAAYYLGFTRHYITAEETKHIMARRKTDWPTKP